MSLGDPCHTVFCYGISRKPSLNCYDLHFRRWNNAEAEEHLDSSWEDVAKKKRCSRTLLS